MSLLLDARSWHVMNKACSAQVLGQQGQNLGQNLGQVTGDLGQKKARMERALI